MKSTVHIHHNRLIWIHKGQRILLSLSEAKALSTVLMDLIPELESHIAIKPEVLKPVQDIDTELRSQPNCPDWLHQVRLENGSYERMESFGSWSDFWNSVCLQESELLKVLMQKGAFDALCKQDSSLVTIRDDTILSDRIRELSEPMEWVGACSFDMGDDSLEAWDFERPVHTVELTEGFWIGRFPVTQQLFWSIMGRLPEMRTKVQGALKPVVQVSWLDALLFCNRLSTATDREPVYWVGSKKLHENNMPIELGDIRYDVHSNGYRLPSEAEWECAAKSFQPFQFSGSEDANAVAWTSRNSEDVLPRVGMKEPNALGLYDMSGLVWEWCWDGYDSEFYQRSPDSDPISCIDGSERVCRGGSYTGDAINSRVSLRGRANASETWDTLGFRIVCKE